MKYNKLEALGLQYKHGAEIFISKLRQYDLNVYCNLIEVKTTTKYARKYQLSINLEFYQVITYKYTQILILLG